MGPGRVLRPVAALVVLAGAVGGGFPIGFFVRQSTVHDLETAVAARDADLGSTRTELGRQREQLQSLEGRMAKLTGDARALQEQLDARSRELAALQGTRERAATLERRVEALARQLDEAGGGQERFAKIRDVAEGLANDRLLLAELRKDDPETRVEALKFWSDLRGMAVQSNPSLGSKVDKVTTALPAYFSWRERNFASAQESALTFVLTGASAYNASVDEFWGAVLLTVIDRISTLESLTAQR